MRRIPLEDFFRNSERTGFQLSPDGNHISYSAPYADRMNIFVERTDGTGDAFRVTSETERSVDGFMWANNERILFVKDEGGDENYHLYGVNLDGSDLLCYTPFDDVRVFIVDELEDIPDEILIQMNKINPEIFDVYRLNLRSGEIKMVAQNPGNIQGWITDHEGKLRIAVAIVDGVNTQILYRETEEKEFRPVLTTNFKENVSILGFAANNRDVYAATNLGRDKTVLVLMDPSTCEEKELLYQNDRYDVSSMSYSRRYKKLLFASYYGHYRPHRHYFDDEERKFHEHIEQHFPKYRVGIAGCDKAEEKYLLYVGSDRTRGTYYFYNSLTDEFRKIADTAPWIKEEEMVVMHPVTYTSRDGWTIEAYLSLPSGLTLADAKNLPVVVHPHGGPWARDYWGFSSEVQFLCNRGYAVFEMNFRSSTGYGRKFMEAGYKQWGQDIQNDITDGVEWLKAQGIADKNRIAIYGGSFGGYAALAGVTFTPDLYCCAVDYVGVSNLFTFMQTIPPYWKPMLEMMYEQVGDPVKDREMMEAYSPALHADKIKVPLFIAQGANDPRVNKAESDQMVEALRARGIDVVYMVKDNEGHGFSNQENRFDFYKVMERFFQKHLG